AIAMPDDQQNRFPTIRDAQPVCQFAARAYQLEAPGPTDFPVEGNFVRSAIGFGRTLQHRVRRFIAALSGEIHFAVIGK
ncbi:MAG TPA: hypothetical protein VIM69_04040, partial [Opitutaceae bacterium]